MMPFSTRRAGLASLAASALVLLLAPPQPAVVDAHGYVTSPMTEFNNGVMFTKYSATMQPAFQGKFDDNPQANVDTFTKAFDAQKQSPGGFPDLRALVKDHGADCGESNPNASPKPIPSDGVVVWQNPDTGEGFVPSHTGPCEIWLDDTQVFHNDNCAGAYPGKPKAEIKVDFSACKGSCILRFYWLALHEPTWQIYKNCIPLTGNGGGGANNNNNGNTGSEYNNNNNAGSEYNNNNNNNNNNNGGGGGGGGADEYGKSNNAESGNAKVTTNKDEYSTPTMAPSTYNQAPAPSRRKCDKIRPSSRKRV